MTEKMVYVTPQQGIIRTLCEMEDTPDPEVKVFRFKEWPMHEGGHSWSGMREDNSAPRGRVRKIAVYSYWNSEFDCGEIVADYRVTAQLETPPGYIAAYEGTTKPEPKPDPIADGDPERTRLLGIEDKIISVLESGGRMVLSALKRKTHSYRFGDDWEKCLHNLAEQGELEIQTDGAGRQWVCTTSVTT